MTARRRRSSPRRGSRRRVQGALLGALLAVGVRNVGASSPPAQIEGVVLDEDGGAEVGADVVAIVENEVTRHLAVCDREGWFRLDLPGGGTVTLLVLTGQGATVASRIMRVAPGERVVLEVVGTRVGERTRTREPAQVMGDVRLQLSRSRDVAGLVPRLPGGAAGSVLTGGPGLLGAGPGELRLVLDGLDLADPISGAAPLGLPLALVDRMGARADLGADERATGGAVVELGTAGDVQGWRSRAAGGLDVVPAGVGTDSSTEGRLELASEGALPTSWGAARFGVRAALGPADPTSGPSGASVGPSPGSSAERLATRPAGRSTAALAFARASVGSFGLRTTGLVVDRTLVPSRTGALVAADAPAQRQQGLSALSLEAHRPLGGLPEGLALSAGLVNARERSTDFLAERRGQGASRLTLRARVAIRGELVGAHVAAFAAGLATSRASRDAGRPARLLETGLAGTATSTTPWVAWDHLWRPRSFLEVGGGLRAESTWARGGASSSEAQFEPGPRLLPHGRLQLRHERSGLSGSGSAGRYGVPLWLDPLLRGTPPAAKTPTLPVEDVYATGLAWRGARGEAQLDLLQRETRSILEDRAVVETGRLELGNPGGAWRRYRALVVQGEVRPRRGFALGGAWALGSLAGDHVGGWDPGPRELRPGSTAAFDGMAVLERRAGPLPLDRRHAFALHTSAAGALGPWTWLGLVAGHLASGAPEDALGASRASGPGEVFLVPRGSWGRTAWSGSLDASLTVSRRLGPAHLSMTLEGYNLTGHRTVTARDPQYTDQVTGPRAWGGLDLSDLRVPSGDPVARLPGFGAPIERTPPRLLRLWIGAAL